jgi:Cys-rich protein (TIGR01571 family)
MTAMAPNGPSADATQPLSSQPIDKNGWSHGLLQCVEDSTTCIDTFFCMYCSVGRQWNAVQGKVDSMNWPICLLNSFATIPCVHWPSPVCVTTVLLRFDVTAKYGIDEHPALTFLTAACCPWCSAVQTYRELNCRGAWPGGTACVPQPMVMGKTSYMTYPGPSEDAFHNGDGKSYGATSYRQAGDLE